MTASRASAFAPAKINLSLHVCGRRDDGYHLLDSVVVFAGIGDRITAATGSGMTLRLAGPFAGALTATDDNLVLRAARFLQERNGGGRGVDLILDKQLPVASGIGGGSSDAAATLIACGALWGLDPAHLAAAELATLGADVPVCFARGPRRMRGIGETLDPLPELPSAWIVLVNPGRPLATRDVFAALKGRHSGPLPPPPARFESLNDLIDYLAACGNDLAPPALESLPEISAVLDALKSSPDCRLARLSGSGPTCFGLFASADSAAAAARRMPAHWWARSAPILRESDPKLAVAVV